MHYDLSLLAGAAGILRFYPARRCEFTLGNVTGRAVGTANAPRGVPSQYRPNFKIN